MKILRAYLLASVHAGFMLTNAQADQFVNGNFEVGTLTGWAEGGGTWSGGSYPTAADYLPGGANYVAGSARNAITNPGFDPNTNNILNMVYAGAHSVRVNDPINDYSVSVISQRVNNYTDSHVAFAYAAVLESSHGPADSDAFIITLTDSTTKETIFSYNLNSATAPGVFTEASASGRDWFYTNWLTQNIDVSSRSGHDFILSLLANDCPYGGHAGYAYLDGFGGVLPPPGPGGVYPYWNGSVTTANGVVNGGDGIWDAAARNWTVASGSSAGAYTPTSTIFAGAPGRVTVDNSLGQISLAGATFLVSGYTIAGDPISLDVPNSTISVGDGTPNGAKFIATIDAPLTGSGGLTKTDLGKLILSGANTFTGPTMVSGGELQVVGSIALAPTTSNSAALTLNGSNTTFSGTGGGSIKATGTAIALLNGVAQNATFIGYSITSAGDLIFADPSVSTLNFAYTTASAGASNLAKVTNGSTLTLNAIGSTLTGAFATETGSTSNFNLGESSNWTITGPSTITNLNLSHASAAFQTGSSFKTLMVNNYVGASASLTFNAALSGSNPRADQLVINGGQATGSTVIVVNPTTATGGANAVSLVATTNGGTIASGAFTLSGPLVVGGTAYALQERSDAVSLVPGMTISQAGGSAASLAQSRQTQVITGRVLSSILTGATEQINCSSCSSGFASFGSFAFGAHGRWELSPSLSLLAGASYDNYHGRGVTVNNALIAAAALRYDPADMGRNRPFVEAGLAAQPYANVTFRRSYQTSAFFGGSGVGLGNTLSRSAAVYGRIGYIWRLTRADEAAAYTDITRSWQWTGGYVEGVNPANPFGAEVAPSLDTMNVWRVGGQWTHLFGEHIEANVSLGYARAFAANYGGALAISAFGPGGVTGFAPSSFDWGEWGGRLSYRFSKNLTGDAFALGTLGAQPAGTQLHGGVALRMTF